MSAAESRRTLGELARLGTEILTNRVQPMLGSKDDGKFVAVDVETGDYEVHEDDSTTVMRLLSRRPTAEIWLGCVGQPTAYRMRRGR